MKRTSIHNLATGLTAVAFASLAVGATSGRAGDQPTPAALPGTASSFAAACRTDAIAGMMSGLPVRVTINEIPNGPKLAGGVRLVPAAGKLPAYCQVTGSYVTNPATGKTANFLANLPERWNGKYLQLGCSGSCGVLLMNNAAGPSITITAQGYPGQLIEKGYASFGNDLGHVAAAPNMSWDWAVGRDGRIDSDALTDYLYRADSVLADMGKAFAGAFYASTTGADAKISRSYFSGCSQGGREALVAAARFPDKFDGIIAGSPASDLPGLIFPRAGRLLLDRQAEFAMPSPAQVKVLNAAVVRQCDMLDGTRDGLVQNPAACGFDARRDLPICTPGKSGEGCFTNAQLNYVSVLTSGTTDEAGRLISPGYSISDLSFTTPSLVPEKQAPDSVIRMFAGGSEGSLVRFGSGGKGPIQSFRVIGDSAAYQRVRAVLREGTPEAEDLSRLVKARGKLLWYHNLSDETLSPFMSIIRYKRLAALNGGYAKLQRNVRLFTLPGTGHCGMSGEGPTNFDAIGALESWVEEGKAPNAILARKLDPKISNVVMGKVDWSQPPVRTMPLCAFPQMAKYAGTGDVNDASNWRCTKGDTRMLGLGASGRQAGVLE